MVDIISRDYSEDGISGKINKQLERLGLKNTFNVYETFDETIHVSWDNNKKHLIIDHPLNVLDRITAIAYTDSESEATPCHFSEVLSIIEG